MRFSSLTLKIYLFAIVAVLATAAMVGAVALALQSEHRQNLLMASGPIARSLWLDHEDTRMVREAPNREVRSSGVLATLYDPSGTLIASTASPPFSMPSSAELGALREKGFVQLSHGVMLREVRSDGRVVAIGIVKFGGIPSLSTFVYSLPVLLVALLAAALIFAGRLARPLQHVATVAKRFGQGDLTARVKSQRKDEIGEVGRAFDAMADRVAGLMSAQQELMANVSHELRTPVSRIQVAVDLITDGKAEQARELVPDIAQDLAELDRLIDDVMTVAKLDLSRSGGAAAVVPLRLDVQPMGGLLDEAISRFRSLHPARQLVVELDRRLPELSVDPVLLRRVVDNLLENARKFSDPDSIIHLSAHCAEAGLTITIRDNGIGIPEADVQNVFVPFFRSDKSRSRATGGVGLGLALARRIVEAHKGTIQITSKLGEGTTVTLELPAEVAASTVTDHPCRTANRAHASSAGRVIKPM
jgi:signal transduction histidine kinase